MENMVVLEIEKTELKSVYGGKSIEVILNVIINNESYRVSGCVAGIESGSMRIDVSEVELPENTTEDTLCKDIVKDIVENFYY